MKNRLNYLIITIPFVIGLVVGSFFDLQINTALYMDPRTNVFGLIFSAFMPLISYAFVAFLGGYYLRSGIKLEVVWQKILFFVLSAACIGVSVYFAGDKYASVNAFGDDAWKVPGLIIALVVEGGIFALGFLTARKEINKAFLCASVVLIIMITVELVPVEQILKDIMRRPRYRTIRADSPFHIFGDIPFKNWWEPFGDQFKLLETTYGHDLVSEHFKSFPSGHTAEAVIPVFGLAYLTMLFPKLEKKETLMVCVGMLFALLMAFSRMTMGAHYLTDVSMGGLTCSICLIIANEINLKVFIK